MVYCAVVGCSSNNNKRSKYVPKCRFFSFPRDKQICESWIRGFCQRHTFNIKTARICSKHFLDSDYRKKELLLQLPKNKWRLKPDAIPSLNLNKSPNTQMYSPFQTKCNKRMKTGNLKDTDRDDQCYDKKLLVNIEAEEAINECEKLSDIVYEDRNIKIEELEIREEVLEEKTIRHEDFDSSQKLLVKIEAREATNHFENMTDILFEGLNIKNEKIEIKEEVLKENKTNR